MHKRNKKRSPQDVSQNTFYRWSERDFHTLSATQLQEGDEIAYSYGGASAYGAIPIEALFRVSNTEILLQYCLPRGAYAQSTPTTEIAVFWEQEKMVIQISQHLQLTDRVLIR